MIEDLRFVQGAVARKDYVPCLTHFRIENGRVTGFNGAIALSSPIKFDIPCSPRATPFVKAIQTCPETIQLHLTPQQRLCVKSGPFTAYVECTQEPFPEIKPDGDEFDFRGVDLVDALCTLAPFIAEDASRPWAQGIMFAGGSAYATNNIVLLEKWLGGAQVPSPLPIPKEAVTELLRIGENPVTVRIAKDSATFLFESGRWLRAQLCEGVWPDVSSILDAPGQPGALPEGFWAAVESLVPFADDMSKLRFRPGAMSTGESEGDGASMSIAGLPDKGCFNAKQLVLLSRVASAIDFSVYPKPCPFQGDRLRGVLVGMYEG